MLIPLRAVPAQAQSMTLGGQQVRLAVREKKLYESTPASSGPDLSVAGDGTVVVFSAVRRRLLVKRPALFVDLLLNDAPILSGVLCRTGVRLVRDAYLGFVGDLAFYDARGSDDPVSSGLGTRWFLFYLNPAELDS